MKTVNIQEAKTQLSRLIAEVEAGEDVVLARGGKPVARLVRVGDAPAERRFGAMRGAPAPTTPPSSRSRSRAAAWDDANLDRLLLDTHALLCGRRRRAASDSGAGGDRDPSRTVLVSAASAWEITTKHRLGSSPARRTSRVTCEDASPDKASRSWRSPSPTPSGRAGCRTAPRLVRPDVIAQARDVTLARLESSSSTATGSAALVGRRRCPQGCAPGCDHVVVRHVSLSPSDYRGEDHSDRGEEANEPDHRAPGHEAEGVGRHVKRRARGEVGPGAGGGEGRGRVRRASPPPPRG